MADRLAVEPRHAAQQRAALGPRAGEGPQRGLVALVEQRDRAVLDAVLRGRTRDVLGAATDVRNQGRPSGLPTLVVLSELVTGLRGEALAYALAPVPGPAPGWAGLAGARFSAH